MDKLLLIDDEADVRYSFDRIFGQEAGLELHTAGSGEEALELIPQLRPHLVIMDVRMSGLTGIETRLLLRYATRLVHPVARPRFRAHDGAAEGC